MRLLTVCSLVFVGAALCAFPVLGATQEKAQPETPSAAQPKGTINLNSATLDQLETLPGVGRKMAERIVEYRQKNGGFKKIEDLMNVQGIGEKNFLKLKPLVFVPAKTDKAGQ
jgi:competence protein ComEA